MTIKFILSETAKQNYFAEHGQMPPSVIQGEVNPEDWSKDYRKEVAPLVTLNGIDLTKYVQVVASKPTYGRLNKIDFRSSTSDPEKALSEYIHLLKTNDERQVMQERQKMQEGKDIEWNPILPDAREYKERRAREKKEQMERENAAFARQRQKERAEREEKEKKEAAEAKVLLKWAKENGSGLLKARIKNKYEWKKLAVIERLESATGLTWACEESNTWTSEPSMEAMELESEVLKKNPFDWLDVAVAEDDEYQEVVTLSGRHWGMYFDLLTDVL